MDQLRRPSRRPLDREHEHSAGRQQDPMSRQWTENQDARDVHDDVRGARPEGGIPSHRLQMWYGLSRAGPPGLGAPHRHLAREDGGGDPRASPRPGRRPCESYLPDSVAGDQEEVQGSRPIGGCQPHPELLEPPAHIPWDRWRRSEDGQPAFPSESRLDVPQLLCGVVPRCQPPRRF